MARPRGTKQVASGAALEPYRALIAELRVAGTSLQDIANRLSKLGIKVNRNAVDRFCKKHGIAGRDDKASSAAGESPVPKSPTMPPATIDEPAEAAPEVVVKRPAAVAAEAKRGISLKPHHPNPTEPKLVQAPPAAPVAKHSAALLGISTYCAPEQATSERNPVRIDLGPVPSTYSMSFQVPASTPPPSVAAAEPSQASPVSSAPPVTGKDHLAIAKVMAELGPHLEAIERAVERGDHDAVVAAMSASVQWLQNLSPDLPQHAFEIARKAIADTRALLATAQKPAVAAKVNEHALFSPLARAPMWEPEVSLLALSDGTDVWTLRDACEGTLILGATGSGKTSGSGALIAKAFLEAHFGGLVLTAKQDEASLWEKYANITGRQRQMCFVRPGGPFRFNFLNYQSNLPADQGGSTENVVEVLYAILESFSRGGRRGDENGAFWANTAKQLLRNLVRVMRATRTPLSLGTFRRFMSEAPQSIDEARTEGWKSAPVFGKIMTDCHRRAQDGPRTSELDEALRYWLGDFPNLNPKTRSIVVTDFAAMIDLFFDPTLEELFLKDTTITPEAALDGAVIVIDLPIEKFLAIGRLAQIVWKFFMQLAVKRRTDADDASRRPLFLWIDEFQSLLSESDSAFQATARSARCATVLLTQNMPGLYAQAGPLLPRERIDALAGNLSTKFFHANSDPTTNAWAAEQIGKSMQYRASVSSGEPVPVTSGWLGRLFSVPGKSKTSTSPVIDFEVQPAEFTKLRTGGERHEFIVDAYLVKSGATFSSTDKSYVKTFFLQETLA